MSEPTIQELLDWDRRHVWHAFTQMAEYEPLLIERGEGCTVYDHRGRAYLDGTGSLWCNVHGHRHPRVDAAIKDQLGRIAHTTNLGASNSTTVRLARRLAELLPELPHVFFSDSGATAVEVALKIAFQYWQQVDRASAVSGPLAPDESIPKSGQKRTRFMTLTNAYHGDTIGAVSLGGVERFHALFAPLLFKCIRVPAPDMYRLPEGITRATACGHYLAIAEQIFEQRHHETCALFVEPLVQAAAGMLMHPPGYLAGLRELTRRYGVLLVADEVAVGIGRTGTMFACQQERVVPDIMCLAKGLSGGYLPIAATMATTPIWETFLGSAAQGRQLFHGHTYGGNPLAAAAALASLELMESEMVLANLPKKVERLWSRLARVAKHVHVGDVRQRGMMAGIELVRSRRDKRAYPPAEERGRRACLAARERGVLLRPLGDVVVLMPPLSISVEQIDQLIDAVVYGIDQATKD